MQKGLELDYTFHGSIMKNGPRCEFELDCRGLICKSSCKTILKVRGVVLFILPTQLLLVDLETFEKHCLKYFRKMSPMRIIQATLMDSVHKE